MSAIANISAALVGDGFKAGYDALTTGSLADAAAWFALAYEASETNDHAPESTRATEYPCTVRPGKKA